MSDKTILYMRDGACSMVPHMLLRELGLPYEYRRMIFSPEGVISEDGGLTAEQYRKIHHAGYVPALDIGDGVILTENPAILTYIASLVPEKHLLGTNDVERAQVAQWMAWLSGTLHSIGFGMVLAPKRFVDDEKLFEIIRSRGRDVVNKGFVRIEERLQEHEYMVGVAETTVDYNIVVFWMWGVEKGWDMEGRFPNYTRAVRRLQGKHSVKGTFEAENMTVYLP